jgi:hypothetical protein
MDFYKDVLIMSLGMVALCLVPAAPFIIYGVYKSRVESERRKKILAHDDWPEDVRKALIAKRIAPGMSEEMVLLGWGRPSHIEQKEITATSVKTRWIYGTPRRGANYVWFKNGEVWKIQK